MDKLETFDTKINMEFYDILGKLVKKGKFLNQNFIDTTFRLEENLKEIEELTKDKRFASKFEIRMFSHYTYNLKKNIIGLHTVLSSIEEVTKAEVTKIVVTEEEVTKAIKEAEEVKEEIFEPYIHYGRQPGRPTFRIREVRPNPQYSRFGRRNVVFHQGIAPEAKQFLPNEVIGKKKGHVYHIHELIGLHQN